MGISEALSLGLVNEVIAEKGDAYINAVKKRAADMAGMSDFSVRLADKNKRRMTDEHQKPLQAYRDHELEKMQLNFYGFDPSYHIARYNFVNKVVKSRTPLTIAVHRRTAEHIRKII